MTGPTVLFEKRAAKYAVRFQFNAQLVDMCKTIPSWGRSYDPATKTWTFERQFAESLADDFRAVGCKVIGLEAEQERRRKAPPLPPKQVEAREGWAAELMRRCPPALRSSVRRNLAKALHSDVGGDGVLMAELNAALNAIDQREGRAG